MARETLIISDIIEIKEKGLSLTVHPKNFDTTFDYKTLIGKEIQFENKKIIEKVISLQINRSISESVNIFLLVSFKYLAEIKIGDSILIDLNQN